MSWLRHVTTAAVAALVVSVASAVYAQNPEPGDAPVRIGPLALAPTFRLMNVGHDDNIFNAGANERPTSDVTATASPTIEAWFRTPRVRISGRGQYDFFYYRELTGLRGADADTSARAEVVVNRLTPFVQAGFVNTRHQNGYEIDIYARRHDQQLRGGVELRLTPKTSFTVYAGRNHSEYESDAVFNGTNLAVSLNHSGEVEGAAVGYAMTPLTSILMIVERQRDRFESSPERNSDSFRIMPTVEFKPRALISGRASVGFRTVTFASGTIPEFRSSVATVDLIYHVRARTEIGVGVRRDLDYSYIDQQSDYVTTGWSTSVSQRIGPSWDVRSSFGWYRLGYRERTIGIARQVPTESGFSVNAEVGYQLGRTRIGFNLDHFTRESDTSTTRTFDRLRVASSITYAFQARR
jgi:hypothetical protein